MPTILCGEHIEGSYDNEVLTFNIYLDVPGTMVFNATKSNGEWVQTLVGIEVQVLDGNIISDGDNDDIYASDFLILGVDGLDAGVYVFYFFVGPDPGNNIDARDGYHGWYDVDITCIPDGIVLSELSEGGGYVPQSGGASTGLTLSTNWFSLQSPSGHLTISASTRNAVILWVAAVLVCSVIAAISIGCTSNRRKAERYFGEENFVADDELSNESY